MKNIKIYLLVMVMSLSLAASAQNATEGDAVDKTLGFGFKGGVNLSNLVGDIEDVELRTTYHFGLYSKYQINDRLAIQPEVLYSLQGTQSKFNAEAKRDFSFLNIPIIAKYYFGDFNLQFGPQVGILIDAEIANADLEFNDIEVGTSETDFSLVLGAGYEMNGQFEVGARYNWGLSNLIDDEVASLLDQSVRNSVVQFYLGFSF